jgi:glycine dehydrogenase subunit 1
LRYLPKSDSERRAMLEACGLTSTDELFSHLPDDTRLNRPLDLEPGKSEYEIVEHFRRLGSETAAGYASFLGAGGTTTIAPCSSTLWSRAASS